MNAVKNKVQLIGYLGNDPEIRTFDNGNKMAKFALATHETYLNSEGERVTDTEWHQVVSWGKLADIVDRYLVKGKEVLVEGKLVTRVTENEEGEKKYYTEIKCNELLILTKASSVETEEVQK